MTETLEQYRHYARLSFRFFMAAMYVLSFTGFGALVLSLTGSPYFWIPVALGLVAIVGLMVFGVLNIKKATVIAKSLGYITTQERKERIEKDVDADKLWSLVKMRSSARASAGVSLTFLGASAFYFGAGYFLSDTGITLVSLVGLVVAALMGLLFAFPDYIKYRKVLRKNPAEAARMSQVESFEFDLYTRTKLRES